MPIPSCPDCGHPHTHCVDWTEDTPEYSCPNCGCYFCEGEDPADRLPLDLEYEEA
jgi:transcription elongation factor Elf1